MEIRLEKPARLGDWLRLYRLYMEAFPASERKPLSIILRMYRNGKVDIWCLREENAFVGLATTINGDDLTLLDYFAVEGKRRGQGVGSAALQKLLARYGEQGMFLEIETTAGNAPNQAQREKRKAFYLRSGLEELHTTAKLFGVQMELLGKNCSLDYAAYKAFYHTHYSPWAAEHVCPVEK